MNIFKIFQNKLRNLISGWRTYGGHVKDAGGAFAEREAALENEYFYRQNRDDIERLRKRLREKLAQGGSGERLTHENEKSKKDDKK